MIFRVPSYYHDFHCIADKCRDNCCIGWEIDIDNSTAKKYRAVTGDFGERLRAQICFGEPSCFVLGEQERCPFLNDRNLCDIYTQLGEEALCQICTDHPRFYEWFGTVREGGIGMGCEEAARIILMQEAPFSVTETEVPDEDCAPYDAKLYEFLHCLREELFTLLHDESLPLSARLNRVLDLVLTAQDCTDNGCFTMPEKILEIPAENGGIAEILHFLRTLEPISPAWHPALADAIETLPKIMADKQRFLAENPQIPKYLRNIAVYYIWRYFLKGVFDEEYLSRAVLAVTSVCVIALLWAVKWHSGGLSTEDCAEIAKNYSKEIEYSEENLNAMLDAAYDLPAMSVSRLKGLLAGMC